MKNYNDAVNQIYAEKEQQIILGLTGRTGAGCSTAAGILKKQFDDLELEYYIDQSENIKESVRNYKRIYCFRQSMGSFYCY